MLVMKVAIRSNPVMRASLRAPGSEAEPSAAPLERCGEGMDMPAPSSRSADPATGRHTRAAAREAGPQGPPRRIMEARREPTIYTRPESRCELFGLDRRLSGLLCVRLWRLVDGWVVSRGIGLRS